MHREPAAAGVEPAEPQGLQPRIPGSYHQLPALPQPPGPASGMQACAPQTIHLCKVTSANLARVRGSMLPVKLFCILQGFDPHAQSMRPERPAPGTGTRTPVPPGPKTIGG